MNGENYYFLTGLSAVIYKIYKWVTGKSVISKPYTPIDPLDYVLKPEYQDFIDGNVWNKHL